MRKEYFLRRTFGDSVLGSFTLDWLILFVKLTSVTIVRQAPPALGACARGKSGGGQTLSEHLI
jgi:hypothetical protein